ncbi:uncharacterized protein EI90DRAFT_3149681 [Cantharellus anzutake]|uniref:uncharacterized protein n=1 Tax=Cantharellus anzutake TaxID=1750568 RepID=UPI001903EA55|nr:uncharacterized protein EI90DRAFT_3149681 [Cantharellus anzutake]KAF8344342.1 hypothetical protein EI90DRAFT_3149681 [Cantharellus anzutake]
MCKDLFEAPVLLSHCGHTFCSLCIRGYLPSKNECPTCRHTTQESSLVRNSTLEDVVFAYRNGRSGILSLQNDRQELIALKRKCTPRDTSVSPRKRKRPDLGSKMSSPWRANDDFDHQEGPSTPRSKRPKPTLTPQDTPRSGILLSDSDIEVEEGANAPDPIVSCPICQTRIRLNRLDPHIERGCSDPEPKKNDSKAWGTLFASSKGGLKSKGARRAETPEQESERKPLPKVTFALVKEKAIRELLSEHGLPTEGDKKVLQDRYNKWIALWNSSIDTSRPKSTVTLRKELKQWERTKEQDSVEKKAREKKIKHPPAYMAQNAAQFADLVAKAKATLHQNRPQVPSEQASNAAESLAQEGGDATSAARDPSRLPSSPQTLSQSVRDDTIIILD